MSASDDSQKPPSLRIRELTITNFRTFVEPTTISFCDAQGNADAIAVFHGDNGSGKSNALVALDLFFQTAHLLLREKGQDGDILLPWDMDYSVTGKQGDRPIRIKYQDRPANRSGPMEIEVQFDDSRLGQMKATYTPSGDQVRLRLLQRFHGPWTAIPLTGRDQFLSWIQSSRGPSSRPLTTIDARRRQRQYMDEAGPSLMPSSLAEYLFTLSTARDPKQRNAWRFFRTTAIRFPSFKKRLLSIELVTKTPNQTLFERDDGGTAGIDLVVEDPGKTVLSLDELSSGEQHVLVLCAASLLARSAILGIEEPEISLDTKNQTLLRQMLIELSQKGFIDQIILESHVALFDGPNVIRFSRDENGATRVKREPSQDEAKRIIEERAKEKGAEHLWVTKDGYTKLPEKMVAELGARDGGHVWFLKGPEHWEAWPEADVDSLFRGEDNGNG